MTFISFVPTVLLLGAIGLIVAIYWQRTEDDILHEYHHIEESLKRTGKMVTAIDYSFSHQTETGSVLELSARKKLVDGFCQISPIDQVLRSESKTDDIPAIDITYMIGGRPSMCDPSSDVFSSMRDKVNFAALLSFLHDIDPYLFGVHYVHRLGYVVSSPSNFVKKLSHSRLNSLIGSPYWLRTMLNRTEISVSGPYEPFFYHGQMLSMTTAVYHSEGFEGLLSLDIDLGKLLAGSEKIPGKIVLIDTNSHSIDSNDYLVYPLNIEGVVFNHALVYQWDTWTELKALLKEEQYSLMLALFFYLLSVTFLFYINSNVERAYYERIASRDPMTGLLNRRGMETFWQQAERKAYFAIAILDIDNFKRINDSFGHDVGDEAICFAANQIRASVRSNDAVARFGGEEFVIFVTADSKQPLYQVMERIRIAISEGSSQVVEGGFTLSGGVSVVSSGQQQDFAALLKAADNKLYKAKSNGKNQLVY